MKFLAALAIGLGWTLSLAAQTASPDPVNAEQRYQAGLDKQTQAELSSHPEDARKLYREAIAQYQAAFEADPYHCPSQVYCGISLTQLGLLAPDEETRNQCLIEANQRFAAAADCPGADFVAFEQWAVLLETYIYSLVPNDAQRVTVTKEIISVCERGLKVAREPVVRAQFEQRLGNALNKLAGLLPDPAEQAALRQRADTHLRAATEVLAAQQLLQAGLARQAQAELAPTPADARRLYTDALAEYQKAAERQPDHAPIHLLWATCLTQLLPLASDPAEHARWLQQADQRFAIASQCPAPSPTVFEQWANLLMGSAYPALSEPAARRALLERSIEICQRGLALADEPTPRAQLHRHLGSALMWATELHRDPQHQLRLLDQAVDHLRAANQSVTVRQTLYQNGYLGIALLSLGRARQDPALLREAAAEFTAALQHYPNQYPTHYSLAATCSLLGDPDQAARHLAIAIDHDPDGSVARRAAADPDLASVRGSPAYNAALDRRRRLAAEASATDLHQQARLAHQRAAQTNDLLAATALRQQAAALCQQATDLVPDHYPAQALAAAVLVELSSQPNLLPDQQRRYRDAAQSRFAAAAQCPAVDPVLYDQWATFLLQHCLPALREPQDQLRLLTQTRSLLTDGLPRARFTGLRSRLETHLACTLVLLGQHLAPATNAAPLFTEALKHFQAADNAEPDAAAPSVYQLWGTALLRQGQLTRDKMLIRQAIERLSRALERQPDQPAALFGLSAAYAQLRQFEPATRHLQRLLRHDPDGLWQRRAETDPDLRALRQSSAYLRLIRPAATAVTAPSATVAPSRPTISEK